MPGKHKPRVIPMPELMGLETRSYSIAVFAAALHVRPGTVKRWRHEGMPSGRLATGEVVVSPAHAVPWILKHARPSTFSKSSVVYFARKNDLIKIGSSVDPKNRLRKMNVDILVTVLGDKRTELAFHALFADAAIGNEWFRPVPELIELIEALKVA